MSRTVRNWCDICRDLQPDIACITEGCGKKFHEDCLRNAGLWRSEDVRTEYVCPDCRESNTNESFCYICKKELIVAKKRRKRTDGGPPPKRVTRAHSSSNSDLPAKEAADDEGTEAAAATTEEAPADATSGTEAAAAPRRSRRAAALKRAAAAAAAAEDEEHSDGGGDSAAEEGRLKKSDMTANEDFVLCDGCANSAHLRCLGLTSLPQEGDSDLWFCTECDPNSATATCMARQEAERRAAALKSSNANASKNKLGGNVDICYVCQKSGKLLGCDFCEQAFHPRCIDAEFLEFEEASSAAAADAATPSSVVKLEADKWRCPICKGEDPLKNMAHKRLSRTAMLKLSREWQDCIRVAHRKCRLNRDKFLWNCRDTLLPFVTQKTINRLKKQFAPNSRWPEKALPKPKTRARRHQTRVDTDDTTESEREEPTPEEARRELEIAALKSYRKAEKAAKKRDDSKLLKEGVHLKSYQIIGVGWLLNAFTNKAGAILADEMGLGKTIQCLTFLSALKALDLTGPHLIVVPLSTVGNWAREIRKFVPHLKFVKICGSRFEREHTMADPTASQGLYDLYITTYETVVTEESFFCDNFSWQTLILDEAHRIKNESGRIRHSLDRVAANMRVLLTGTPLQNNVKELFTLLNFLFPDVLKDSDTFEKVFSSKPTGPQSAVDQAAGINEILDANAINAVTHLLGKMMLRRTKDLVVRLPRKHEHDIWIPLSPMSAFWYKKLLDVSEAAFQQQLVKKLLGTVVKMRICCCHPRGLVTRDAQLTRFKEAFMCLEGEEEITESANSLIDLDGEEHIRASSKLVILDKLLTQLHVQNVAVSEPYRRDYVQNVKDLYVQNHPPPPLQPPPPPVKDASAAKKKSASVKANNKSPPLVKAGTEDTLVSQPVTATTSEVNANTTLSRSEPVLGEGSSATGTSTNPPAPAPKPLTARQISERSRRERAAQAAQQQAELEAALEKIGETALNALQPTARDQELFYEMMQPATVPDAPLPQLPETSDVEEEEEEDNGSNSAAERRDDEDEGAEEAEDEADGDEDEEEDEEDDGMMAEEGAASDMDDTVAAAVAGRKASKSSGARSNGNGTLADSNETEPENDAGSSMIKPTAGDEVGEGMSGSNPGLPIATDLPPAEGLVKVKDEKKERIALGMIEEEPARLPAAKEYIPHKVLVFTQFQLVLDELERYCQYRGFKYLRLDGSTNKMIRELDIREFNSPHSTHLVYLICTRAGGVGINLVTANHVVLYDEDWNPFIDLQAIDRAHRIGQKRDVHVWKLITEWTVEERMAFRRMQKLKLDKLLIQANTSAGGEAAATASAEAIAGEEGVETDPAATDEKFSVEEIHRLIRHGRTAIQKVSGEDEKLWDKPLEELLERERRTLPVISEEIEADLMDDEDDVDETVPGKQRVSLVEALEPEDREICSAGGDAGGEDNSGYIRGVSGSGGPIIGSRTTSTDEVDDTDADADDNASQIVTSSKKKLSPGSGRQPDESDSNLKSPHVEIEAEIEVDEKTRLLDQKRATRRLRRRQPLVFQPANVEPVKPRVERKIIHDKKCFRCGSGVNPADESADPLVPCHRCPKVYHKKGCLGFDEFPKKTWTCSWHECCLCFRKGSQAGGLLIHCAECPTTFCFDCFPPEYRRYNPPATYYADLTKRGYPATPEKLVLFLCSRCKALKEQARRRLLSRQQLEAEAKKRKEANLKARVDAQKAKEDQAGGSKGSGAGGAAGGAAGKQSADQRREFQQRKKKIDDIDRQFNTEIRAAYEKLFPPEFMAALVEKRNVLVKQHEAATAAAATPADEQAPQQAQPTKEDSPDPAAAAVATDGSPNAATLQGGSQTSLPVAKPVVAPKAQTVKSPGEALKLCENCHLPGHDSSGCPFVSETEKKNMAPATPTAATVTGADGAPAAAEEEKVGEKLRGAPPSTKRLIRSFCPKCGVSSRNHFRRHCDLLTPEELEEYEKRREKIQVFIKLLQQAQPLDLDQTSFRGLNLVANLEGCRRALQRMADDIMHKCLTEAELGDCVAGPSAAAAVVGPMKAYLQNGGSLSASFGVGGSMKRKDGERGRRKRSRMDQHSIGGGSPDGGDNIEQTGADTDDPSYSPRKKSRLAAGDGLGGDRSGDQGDEGSDHNGGPTSRAPRRPRRANPRVNFRDLEASPAEEDNASMEDGPSESEPPGITIDLRKQSISPKISAQQQAPMPRRMSGGSPHMMPQSAHGRRPSMDGGPTMDMNGRGPTFSTIGPPRMPPVGADQSRLPPSRWHHGPAAAAAAVAGMNTQRMSVAAAAQMMGAHHAAAAWGYPANPAAMMNVPHRGYFPAPMMAPPSQQWPPQLTFAQQQAAAEMWRAQQQYAAAAAAAQQQHHGPPPRGPP